MAAPTTTELLKRIEALETELQWMRQMLELCGIRGPWFSPQKTSALLGISRSRVMLEIEMAEKRRALNKPSDAVYGVHYRNIQHPTESIHATWQVNIFEFDKLLSIPPDARKL